MSAKWVAPIRAVVNVSDSFVSPDLHKRANALQSPTFSNHRQPHDARRVVDKLRQIARRTKSSEEGFDAFGIVAVDFQNDGGPVRVSEAPPAPEPGDIFEYDAMVRRVADAYEARFR
jgi:hypothetical protein